MPPAILYGLRGRAGCIIRCIYAAVRWPVKEVRNAWSSSQTREQAPPYEQARVIWSREPDGRAGRRTPGSQTRLRRPGPSAGAGDVGRARRVVRVEVFLGRRLGVGALRAVFRQHVAGPG